MAAFEPMNYDGRRPMFFPARNPPQGNHGPGARYPGPQYPGIAGQIRHLPEFEQNQGQPQNSAQTAWVKGGWKNRENGGPKDQHKKEIAKFQRALEAVIEVYGENSDQAKDIQQRLEKVKEVAKAAANIISPAEKRRQIEGALGRVEAALQKITQEYAQVESEINGWQAKIDAAKHKKEELHNILDVILHSI